MKKRRPLLFFLFLLLASAALAWVSAQSEEETPLETFVPSEELTADGAVSFPVDI